MRLALIALLMLPLTAGCVYKDKDTGEPDSMTISYADTDSDADAENSDGDAESCSFASVVCLEPNEPDNEVWCASMGGTSSPDSCPDGATGQCDIPAGGDYTAPAIAYYYYYAEAEEACAGAGGTYTEL